ncbi:TPA: thymidine kinase [Candidatus Dependentiae bacterium]|nr:MAG: Thymidine kinase [candidate division TM6 bacterium GW2011_GWE2_31_21]KKP54020.1 MAG: Thymidine kinase [candidate division TM6 bacterium GW2011_GWF2_33_332]HBS48398.1 thymidine kinase [Candidatus Dependentiae bacterium]HBZ72928.1 thymidine kinase [Candidatus Dependentiae bacterium]
MKKGSLEVICGSMFSGKTEELMRRLRRAEFAKQNILTIKHKIDVRKSYECIVSHNGAKREAFAFDGTVQCLEKILKLSEGHEVVGLDEIHFFIPQIIETIKALVDNGKRVIIAGLDIDFRGEPFAITATLLAIADEVTKLKAICVKCGKDAKHNQRIINGNPAKYDDPIILVGAEECYEARCRDCFEIEKPAKDSSINIFPSSKTKITENEI